MDNLNLLNAFLFAGYWLVEILKAVVSLIFLPFQIFFAFFTMNNIGDAFACSVFLAHSRWNNLKKFGLTFKLTIHNKIPSLTIHSYDEDSAEASKQINTKKYPTIRACITDGLKEAHRYRYVIFQNNSSESTFIQLRSDTGIYLFDFPLTPLTLNRDYAIELIDYLRTKGFEKTAPGTAYWNKTYCIDAIEDELTTIQANFGKNKTIALDMCTYIFTKIFKTTTIPEIIFG